MIMVSMTEKKVVFQNFFQEIIFGHSKNVHFSKPKILFGKNLLLKNITNILYKNLLRNKITILLFSIIHEFADTEDTRY